MTTEEAMAAAIKRERNGTAYENVVVTEAEAGSDALQARAILAALAAAGWAVVPMEATEEMLKAGGEVYSDHTWWIEDRGGLGGAIYRAMLAAARRG